ncbi:MAG: hypothetical protein R2824_27030 [Saprospiraceae bacterium]
MKVVYVHMMCLLVLVAIACQNPEQIIETWEDGQPRKVLVKDKAGDLEINYYQNGEKESEGGKLQDKKEGLWEYFDEQGNVRERTHYRAGQPFGASELFFENGMKKSVSYYDESGLRSELWMEYDKNGRLRSKGQYESGSKLGLWAYYSESGVIAREEYILKADEWKYLKEYDENGSLKYYLEFYPNGVNSIEKIRTDKENRSQK